MKRDYTLSLSDSTFAGLKGDFDTVINTTLLNMEERKSPVAEITVKLKIELTPSSAPDRKVVAYKAARDIIKPTFTHKVTSVMKIQDERSGALSGDFELVWDRGEGRYLLRPLEDGQTSLFDVDDLGIDITVEPDGIVRDIKFNKDSEDDED